MDELEMEFEAPEDSYPDEAVTEPEETDQEDGEVIDTDPADQEESETDPEEPVPENEESESMELKVPDQDTSLTVSGNVIVLPEGYDFSGTSGYSDEGLEAVLQAIEGQTEIVRGGSSAVSFLLGIIAGILLVQGFRLRRI